MYDAFSEDYDRFVNWAARLATELPFIEGQLQAVKEAEGRPARVLDAACGTGIHAIALAQNGYPAAGADLSGGMVERARANAAAFGVSVRFEKAGFGDLRRVFGSGQFDALICLGNSLPHLLTPQDLAIALADFAACLRPSGLILVQNRNFDAVMARRERWMEPQSYREGDSEWIFVRFYDYKPGDWIDFNILTLRRSGPSAWEQHVSTTRLRPLLQAELETALTTAGFTEITSYGNMAGELFEPETSGNLIIRARLAA
jgi:SAM-dependent methyltransferase